MAYRVLKPISASDGSTIPTGTLVDADGWPHYKVKEELPPLKAGEQSVLMKEAIVNYFIEKELID